MSEYLVRIREHEIVRIFIRYGLPALIVIILAVEYTYLRPIRIEVNDGYISADVEVRGSVDTN